MIQMSSNCERSMPLTFSASVVQSFYCRGTEVTAASNTKKVPALTAFRGSCTALSASVAHCFRRCCVMKRADSTGLAAQKAAVAKLTELIGGDVPKAYTAALGWLGRATINFA